MKGVRRVLRTADSIQRRSRVLGFGYAVVKKFGDDQAGYLAALIAYYAFFALFPLLLVLVTVLGILLRHDPGLRHDVLSSALGRFPVVGTQLRHDVHSLGAAGAGLVVGVLGTFYGARGVASAAQHAFNTVWEVPYAQRPGFPWDTLRSLGILAVVGVGLVASTGLAGLGSHPGALGVGLRAAAVIGGVAVNVGVFLAAFRLATAGAVATRSFVPGAVLAAVCWQLLQVFGTAIVTRYLEHASAVYGTFAIVIGLLSWVYLQAQITLYAAESDSVRVLRLWPRALVAPPYTDADERAHAAYAAAQRRRSLPGATPAGGTGDPPLSGGTPPDRTTAPSGVPRAAHPEGDR